MFQNIVVAFGGVYAFWKPMLDIVWDIITGLWWLWLFMILFTLAKSTWVFWRQQVYKNGQQYALLEIRVPRETMRDPQAMVQVLSHINTLRNEAGDIREKYWDGEVTDWFSFEMVSFGGEIHFFLRVPVKRKNIVEASFFAHYPDIEIREVPDYTETLPATVDELYARGMEMWGAEMVFVRDDMYPILSYENFKNPEEERELDPISTFLEVLGKLTAGEFVGIQFNASPSSPFWQKKWEGSLKKLRTPEETPVRGAEGQMYTRFIMRSPGETDVLEAVEKNLSQPAFDTIIRFTYMAPRASYSETFARRGVAGAFNQYGTLNLNAFIRNFSVETRARIWRFPFIFPKIRVEARKQRLLLNYRQRAVPEETFIGKLLTAHFFNWNFASRAVTLSLKSLATLYHPPMQGVLLAPYIKRVESKRVAPPSGVAIFGEEKDIAQFLNKDESKS